MKSNKKHIRNNVFEATASVDSIRSAEVLTPAIDIMDHPNGVTVLADMPGVDEKSVEVTIEKNLLTIHGHLDREEADTSKLLYSECPRGDYERMFALSERIDRERIHASFKDGVLKVVLPKSEKAKTKRIPITGEA